MRLPPVPPKIDQTTGQKVCAQCEASLEGMIRSARFCSHSCRSKFHNPAAKKRAWRKAKRAGYA